jgi:UDP-N-acetylmuramoyl-L-alanyl-D-glutamate--2,6-diaminopimelate ligase
LKIKEGNLMTHRQLHALLTYLQIDTIDLPPAMLAMAINHLRIDSRKINPNDVFIALKGHKLDGHTYISQAVDAGAIMILSQTDQANEDKQISYINNAQQQIVPIIKIYQLDQYLSDLGNFFYDNPSSKLTLIGVTGTNGKTTVTQLLAQWITLLGQKAAVMGTIGNGVYGQLSPTANTTMSAIDVQSTLAELVQQKVDVVAMEVSSHGLVEKRVAAVSFAATAFTNLSRDHLDYHGTMENYAQAKWALFNPSHASVKTSGFAIINIDDDIGEKWIGLLPKAVTISIDQNKIELLKQHRYFVGVHNIQYHNNGVKIEIASSWGEVYLDSALIGEFNVANLLIALGTLLVLGYPLTQLSDVVKQLNPVQGRMEVFNKVNKPTIIVDYAHTPDALIKALQAARRHCVGQLWVIFGCGGDRDRGKRRLMAEAAEQYADHIMITNDNPRTEDQRQIIEDILQGIKVKDKVNIELDRYQAIKQILSLAKVDDTILIAGKGHEDYQIIGMEKRHYSDRETAATLLGLNL